MTECSFAIDHLLEADPAELVRALGTDGKADSSHGALARHLVRCARCRDVAHAILASNRRMHDVFAHAPELDVDALLARATLRSIPGVDTVRTHESETHGVPVPDGPEQWTTKANPVSLIRRWRLWAPFAVAASLVGVLIAHEIARPMGEIAGRTPVMAPHADFEVPAGRNLAVLQTDNPTITVLWFF